MIWQSQKRQWEIMRHRVVKNPLQQQSLMYGPQGEMFRRASCQNSCCTLSSNIASDIKQRVPSDKSTYRLAFWLSISLSLSFVGVGELSVEWTSTDLLWNWLIISCWYIWKDYFVRNTFIWKSFYAQGRYN